MARVSNGLSQTARISMSDSFKVPLESLVGSRRLLFEVTFAEICRLESLVKVISMETFQGLSFRERVAA